ncbi:MULTISPECIES: LuxR C-terminal-related transcriptional regulator [Actinomycetes]|uniref:LuxR C-terminal-related transcriptional regulator n=1 Tax=Actinomycetes TaxID=1760 RepID=UPI00136D2D30|nr:MULTISPECIES: LuxR C-terminal-related transcriptional regulator [Streptomyces]MCE3030578.1 LuxR C-terminal-related transcriptional regulator [Streptomyces sp. CMSTAAHL-2]MYR17470.1 PAS domain-containing protein [Streptomyces sp. SID6137]
MASLDKTLAIQQANQEFFRQFNASSEDLCGRNFRDVVHPSARQPLVRQFANLLEGKHQRFVTPVLAVGPGEESAFTVPLTAVAVRGGVPDTTAILVMMPTAGDGEEARVVSRRKKILSSMDARILEGIAAGVSTIPLAASLYLSRQGVEYHVTCLLRKLKVPNRAALVSRAYSMGVLKVGAWPPEVVEDFVK